MATPNLPRRRNDARALITTILALVLAVYGVAAHPSPAGANDATFSFDGGGWGHGVGMSQWGARGMAERGSTAQESLRHYYSGVSVGTGQVNDDLRVLIAQSASSIKITAHGPTVLSGIGTMNAGSSVTLTRVGTTVSVSGAFSRVGLASVEITYPATAAGAVEVAQGSQASERYRYGSLTVRIDPAGGLRAVIGGLTMQQYLYGLAEMYTTWPAAALQAQAIAGRTFAQKQRAKRTTADFDLYASVTHQSYRGTKFEVAAWTNAVDATNKVMLTHGGALIDAVYSASSGGHTENSEVVWVATVPYLRGVADPYDNTGGNPNGTWTRSYTGAELGGWFGVGVLQRIEVVGTPGVSGRLDKTDLRLVGSSGTKTVSGITFRSTVNSKVATARQLMSTKFTVRAGATPPATTPPPTAPPTTMSSVANTMPSGAVTVARADGRTIVIAGRASDPQGAPIVRVVSTMGSQRAVRDVRANGGSFSVAWAGAPGTRNVCVSVLDVPTGSAVSLGCRDVVVK